MRGGESGGGGGESEDVDGGRGGRVRVPLCHS